MALLKELWLWVKGFFTIATQSTPLFKNKKTKVVVYELIKVTASGHHAWYNSNVGIIRKPLCQMI